MPRGRPKKTNKEEAVMETVQAGPAEGAVAATVVDTEPKKVVYQRILFRNLQDPNVNLPFTNNGLSYNLIDGDEVTLRKEIVDYLASRMVPDVKWTKNASGDSVKVTSKRPRFLCQVIETFEK